MSVAEILEQLETLTPEERQTVIDRAIELDEPIEIPEEHRKLIEERLAEHDADPSSSIPVEEALAWVRAQRQK